MFFLKITKISSETVLPQIQREYEKEDPYMGAVLNNQRIAPFFKVYSEFLSRKEATCDAKVKRIQQVQPDNCPYCTI